MWMPTCLARPFCPRIKISTPFPIALRECTHNVQVSDVPTSSHLISATQSDDRTALVPSRRGSGLPAHLYRKFKTK